MSRILAYDLGTGGVKACLYDEAGRLLGFDFEEYQTTYPAPGYQEQCPEDWWRAMVRATTRLSGQVDGLSDVAAIGVSGHSLGVVAVGGDGALLSERTPIWSDARAAGQAEGFFRHIDADDWYLRTGGGFPAHLYAVFKIMWYRDCQREIYDNTAKFLGSKDYINYRLTGVLATDPSYASGSGAYDLRRRAYVPEWIDAVGIDRAKLADIVPSASVLGCLTAEAARALGLPTSARVVAGGVDNACMALGANCYRHGESYTSLGTSAWVAVSSGEPVVDLKTRPYVFEHCVPGQYVSATCIFSAGGSFRWVRDTLCAPLVEAAAKTGEDPYTLMTALAATSPVGARRLLFNPSLSGGSSLDASPSLRGCYAGLDLMHTQADLIRSAMEGIAMNMRMALDALARHCALRPDMLIVGGGVRSALWRQIFADVYEMDILETAVGQDAGALGAAALAATGCGLWPGLDAVARAHTVQSRTAPIPENTRKYRRLMPAFQRLAAVQCEIGGLLSAAEL